MQPLYVNCRILDFKSVHVGIWNFNFFFVQIQVERRAARVASQDYIKPIKTHSQRYNCRFILQHWNSSQRTTNFYKDQISSTQGLPVTQHLIKRISVRFPTPEVVKNGISLNTFEDIENFLPLDKVFLGFSTSNLRLERLENGYIDQEQSMKCLTGAQAFRQSALEYVLKKWMSETFWIHASWIDFFKR